MRARSLIASLVFIIGIPLAWGVWPSVAAAQPVIYSARFVGMMPIPGTINISQTALKAGDKIVFEADVHSGFAYPPAISADLSELGVSSPTTTPAGPGSPNYDSNSFYTFGPFTIGADIPDGIKTVSVTATDVTDSVATATAQVIVDNVLPTVTLSNITFSTTSPQQGDFMYLSGKVNGTGTVARVSQLTARLSDTAGNPVVSKIAGSATVGYDSKGINAALATSTDGSFSNVPIQFVEFGDKGWISRATNISVELLAYDEAGNFASTTLTVPIPKTAPPDPCAAPGSCVSNVLFLPGIEGSRLYEGTGCGKTAEEKLWEPLGESYIRILRGAGDDKVENLFLDQSGASMCPDIYTKEGDVIDSVGGSGIYKSFIDEMNGLKTDGTITDWKSAAYDWRLSLADLLKNGAERDGKIFYEEATSTPYIEQTLRELAASSKTGKVTIIAHSNGGLLAKALLNQLGSEASKLVDKVILVAAPQSGAPTAVGVALFGYDAGIYKSGLLIVSNAIARALAQNSPMAYHLLPSEDYLESTMGDAAHPVIRFAGDGYAKEEATYGNTIANRAALDEFLLAKEDGRQNPAVDDVNDAAVLNPVLIEYANGVHDTLDNWIPPAHIEVNQIAGWGADTVAGIDFYTLPSQLSVLTSAAPVRVYRPIFTEDGDGTVPVPSALMMASSTNVKRYWINLDSYFRATSTKRNHKDLFEIPSLEDFIKNIIENSTSTPPSYISSSQPLPTVNDKKLTFFLHSPLTLQLKDSSGNVTGLASDGSVTQDIPGATYGEFGEVKYITVPQGSSYQLTMHGQSSGTFSLDIQESSGGVITASSTVANVPTTASTLASLTISNGLDSVSPLTVDENGDGKDTITITPKNGETIVYTVPAAPVVPDVSTTQPSQGRAAGGPGYSPYIPAGSISIPVITPVSVAPIAATFATVTAPTASTTPATTTPVIKITTEPKLSLITPHVRKYSSAVVSSATSTTQVPNIIRELPQTASVYEASQPSILKKIVLVVYNGLHGFWIALRRLF